MYADIIGLLPGPRWLRTILFLVLLAGAVYLLVEHVYPAVDRWLYSDANVVGASGTLDPK